MSICLLLTIICVFCFIGLLMFYVVGMSSLMMVPLRQVMLLYFLSRQVHFCTYTLEALLDATVRSKYLYWKLLVVDKKVQDCMENGLLEILVFFMKENLFSFPLQLLLTFSWYFLQETSSFEPSLYRFWCYMFFKLLSLHLIFFLLGCVPKVWTLHTVLVFLCLCCI